MHCERVHALHYRRPIRGESGDRTVEASTSGYRRPGPAGLQGVRHCSTRFDSSIDMVPDVSAQLAEESVAWLALALLEMPPRVSFGLAARWGSPLRVLAASEESLLAAGAPPRVAAAGAGAAARARVEIAALARAGATFVAWSDPGYPALLRQIPDPPLALAVRGTLVADEPAVAIVGSRRATDYGRRMAEDLARGLAQANITVVSGLAAGIDAAAHRGALAAGGRTIAVLGTGIDRVYPRWHGELAAAIVSQGALVSEFACGAPPLRFHFPRRNRLISGLSLGTVVVEAADDSGSLITARHALDQNRDVLAVPGPTRGATHRGPHRLIREGAKLVTCVEDVLEEVAPERMGRPAQARAAAAEAMLTAEERRVLEAIGPEGGPVDDVIRRAAVPAGAALETLLALELRGLVDQLPGKRFRRRAA
jgi:DNA processing protein